MVGRSAGGAGEICKWLPFLAADTAMMNSRKIYAQHVKRKKGATGGHAGFAATPGNCRSLTLELVLLRASGEIERFVGRSCG